MSEISQVKNFVSKNTLRSIIDGFDKLRINTSDPFVDTFNGSIMLVAENSVLGVLSQAQSGLNDADYEKYKQGNAAMNYAINLQSEELSRFYGKSLKQRFLNYIVTKVGGGYDGYHVDSITENGEARMPQGMPIDKWNIFSKKQTNPNSYWHSSILYLNDDYQGGEIEFKDSKLIKPTAGELVYFVGDGETEHGVRRVISGERHALVSFYWDEESHNLYNSI